MRPMQLTKYTHSCVRIDDAAGPDLRLRIRMFGGQHALIHPVRAPRAVGIQEGLLTDPGRGMVEGHVARIGGEHGVQYTPLRAADTIDV